MSSLNVIVLFYISLLQFEGISPQSSTLIYLYSSPGPYTTLPCDTAANHGPTCSSVDWIYRRNTYMSIYKVEKGKIQRNSPGSSRLTLNTNCSLTIHNVTEEDAGLFTCRLWNDHRWDTNVHLSVLTVSPAPPSTNPNQDGTITLKCTLWRNSGLGCRVDGLRWLNINGTVLSGDNIRDQTNCVSSLTVDRQSQHNRKYTCQYKNNLNIIPVSVDYSLEVHRESDPPGNSATDSPDPKSWLVYIVSGAVGSLLVLLAVAAVVCFKVKSKRKSAETTEDTADGDKPTNPDSEVMSCVSFEIINHQHVAPRVKEEHKYCTVETYVRAEEDRESSLRQRNLGVRFYVQ